MGGCAQDKSLTVSVGGGRNQTWLDEPCVWVEGGSVCVCVEGLAVCVLMVWV